MSRRIPFTVGDTSANLDVVILNRSTGAPLDLRTMTVTLRITPDAGGDPTDIAGTLLAGRVMENNTIDELEVAAGAHGRVRFNMATILTEPAGFYLGELRITDTNNLTQTIDEQLKFALREAL